MGISGNLPHGLFAVILHNKTVGLYTIMLLRKILPLLLLTSCLCFILPAAVKGQTRTGTVAGFVYDEEDKPITGVSVQQLNRQQGVVTDASGAFRVQLPSNTAVVLVFSHTGYLSQQKRFYLNRGEQEKVIIRLVKDTHVLENVTVTGETGRTEAGRIDIDASNAINNPSPVQGIEGLIKIFVGSNNELTSQYSVRGGSYDDNLVYVNDFEVYRPYLVRSGQQEGLSFINPEMTGGVKFYNGGFQAKYGDKLSSVLDIAYRRPTRRTSGSAYIGLLEQGLHLEGISKNQKFTYLVGARNRSNQNLLSSQATRGSYIPSSADVQGLLTYTFNSRWSVEAFANFSQTRFTLYPEQSKITSAVFSPLFAAAVGLDIDFEGQEKDRYSTQFTGLSLIQTPRKNLRLKYMVSRFRNNEQENIDIKGDYLFGERDFDNSQSTYGQIVNPLGAGSFQNYARNRLNISVWNISHKGSYQQGNHFYQWGLGYDRQLVHDKMDEFEFQDSAGYSLPYNPSVLNLSKVYKGQTDFAANRYSAYLQDNIRLGDTGAAFTLQPGVRVNYNDLNKELLVSPRVGFSYKPVSWKKNIVFKGAAGIYSQPPFYREMRRFDGTVNRALKAQKSWQVNAGMDYNFEMFGRPAKLTADAYYKQLWDVVPYDLDNVRIRYFGENMAKAYAAGVEGRLFAQFVKDAESFISLGFMRTRENLDNDYYTTYRNAAGETIGPKTQDQVPVDSTRNSVGYVRRPTDRLLTLGMFFQDYLSTNKNFKVYLNLLYGSNLPYNIPGNTRYRNALVIEPYIRADIGFSALLVDGQKAARRSHSPFRNFESIWATFEVFNLIDRENTISYLLIKDFANNTYTMPNRLTPRLVNLKVVARW
jgi:hypothetical protein